MATSCQRIIDNKINKHIGDTGNSSVNVADRVAAVSESIKELYNLFEFDFTNRRYQLNYYDTVNDYNLTVNVPDFTLPVDLRREDDVHASPFTLKSPREIATEINEGATEYSFGVEQRNRGNWLLINYPSQNSAVTLHSCDSTVDFREIVLQTTSDAENLTIDTSEKKKGSGSINFDLDIDQAAVQRMTVEFQLNGGIDLRKQVDLGAMIFWVYLPDVSGTSSTVITGYWGSTSSNYHSATVTTDKDGNAFADGWNEIRINWADTTATGTPDNGTIAYLRIDIAHNSAADDTDFRIDDIRMVKPERLYLHYQSWYVGVESTTATNYLTDLYSSLNVPFYSGVYDYFDTYVGHKAASLLFRQMGQDAEANNEDTLAEREVARLKKKFPHHQLEEFSGFKLKGLKW